MDLPVFEKETRPIRAGPFSDADLFSMYMMRVCGTDLHSALLFARMKLNFKKDRVGSHLGLARYWYCSHLETPSFLDGTHSR